MNTGEKIGTLKLAIEHFKNYINKVDHSQPATQQFIIDCLDIQDTEKKEYLHTIFDKLDSFEILDYGNEAVLSEVQLYEMLQDIENVLDILEA